MSALVSLLVLILVVGLVLGLCLWLIDLAPVIPATFKQFAKAVLVVIAIIIILLRALPMAGVA